MRFTRQEKYVLITILCAAITGLFITIFFSYNNRINYQKTPAHPLKININTADEATLHTVPGIGRVTAQRIIEYRKKNGPFTAIDGLAKIKGMTSRRLEKIKNGISTE